MLVHGPRLQIWRGATDNDGIKLTRGSLWRPLGKWLAQGLDKLELRLVSAKIKRRREGGGAVTFSVEHMGSCAASPRAVRHRCDYTLRPDGSLLAENVFDVDAALPDLPRLGVVAGVARGAGEVCGGSVADRWKITRTASGLRWWICTPTR